MQLNLRRRMQSKHSRATLVFFVLFFFPYILIECLVFPGIGVRSKPTLIARFILTLIHAAEAIYNPKDEKNLDEMRENSIYY